MAIKQVYKTDFTKPLHIEYIKRTQPFNMPNYCFHKEYELYYLISGERHYYLENEFNYVSKGDFIILNKNLLHRTETLPNKPNHERILVNFSDEYLNDIFQLVPDIDINNCFKQLPSIL